MVQNTISGPISQAENAGNVRTRETMRLFSIFWLKKESRSDLTVSLVQVQQPLLLAKSGNVKWMLCCHFSRFCAILGINHVQDRRIHDRFRFGVESGPRDRFSRGNYSNRRRAARLARRPHHRQLQRVHKAVYPFAAFRRRKASAGSRPFYERKRGFPVCISGLFRLVRR